MNKDIKITIFNKLNEEKRDLNIYHHAAKGAYIISHGHSITIPLASNEEDYIHISIVSGPGSLQKDCIIDIPSHCDVSFTDIGNGDIKHTQNRIYLRIPPGPPIWHVKLTHPVLQESNNNNKNYVAISGEINEKH